MSLSVLLYFGLPDEKATMLTKHALHVLPAAVYKSCAEIYRGYTHSCG